MHQFENINTLFYTNFDSENELKPNKKYGLTYK